MSQAASYMLFFSWIPQVAPMWKVVVVIALKSKACTRRRYLEMVNTVAAESEVLVYCLMYTIFKRNVRKKF